MYLKKVLWVFSAAALWLSSCTQPAETVKPIEPRPTKFAEIKAADSFRWLSEKQVTINLTGFPTIEPVTGSLQISTVDGRVLMSQAYTLDTDGSFRLLVPASETQLKLKFGSIEKTIDVTEVVATDLLPQISDIE